MSGGGSGGNICPTDLERVDAGLVLSARGARLHGVIVGRVPARGERFLGVDAIVVAVARGLGHIVPPVPAGGAFAGGVSPEEAAIALGG